MTARLCLIFKSLPDPQPEGKKLRAVIVLGFCILASAAQKTKSRGCSISSCGPFAKRAQPSILFANADHGAGSGNLSFNSSMLPISNSLDPRPSQLQKPSQVLELKNEFTMARPATTQPLYCPASTFGVMRPM
jgi:hypothetical protein